MARRLTDQERVIAALLASWGGRIRDAFLAAIYAARGAVDLAALEAALRAGNIEAAVALFRLDQAALFPLEEEVRGAFIAGGFAAMQGLPVSRGVFGFDGRHTIAEDWVRRHTGTRIQGIREETLQMVRNVIRQGIEDGTNSRAVGRLIVGSINKATGRMEGGILGLTTQQEQWVDLARNELASLDPHYLTRELRDRRFDGMVKRAIKSGKPLSQAEIDRIAGRYSERLLAARGRLIATNETHTALAAGRNIGYRQLLDSGKVEAVKVRWQHNHNDPYRPEHKAMDGTIINLGERFRVFGCPYGASP